MLGRRRGVNAASFGPVLSSERCQELRATSTFGSALDDSQSAKTWQTPTAGRLTSRPVPFWARQLAGSSSRPAHGSFPDAHQRPRICRFDDSPRGLDNALKIFSFSANCRRLDAPDNFAKLLEKQTFSPALARTVLMYRHSRGAL